MKTSIIEDYLKVEDDLNVKSDNKNSSEVARISASGSNIALVTLAPWVLWHQGDN
jgi:hypothetical protein